MLAEIVGKDDAVHIGFDEFVKVCIGVAFQLGMFFKELFDLSCVIVAYCDDLCTGSDQRRDEVFASAGADNTKFECHISSFCFSDPKSRRLHLFSGCRQPSRFSFILPQTPLYLQVIFC